MRGISLFSQVHCLNLIQASPQPLSGPDPRSMHWQKNGELAVNDLQALVHRLQSVEADETRAELGRLSRGEDDNF